MAGRVRRGGVGVVCVGFQIMYIVRLSSSAA